jgi:N-acyl-D-amino-acid deacylase
MRKMILRNTPPLLPLLGAFALLSLAASCRQAAESQYDLALIGGEVVDGSGAPGSRGDVAIKGDRIVKRGLLTSDDLRTTREVIRVNGMVVSPGFIDSHTHSDYTLLVDGTAQSKIRQGVTTEILGESLSAGPIQGRAKRDSQYGVTADWRTLGEYFERLEKSGISLNVASFVGATQVRTCVLGEDSREPTPEEMERMRQLVKDAMEDGALGLSSALLVPPNTYHTTDQLAQLASVVRPYGGIYFTHIRSEGEGIEEAIAEAITIGEKAGVPVEIIHLKVADQRLWGKMPDICNLIEQARTRGLKVTANLYPYTAGQNDLNALIPPWAMEGGLSRAVERMGDPRLRARMKRDIYAGVPGWFNHYLAMGGWENCRIASVRTESARKFEGQTVAQAAALAGKEPAELVFDLLTEEGGSVPAVYFLMDEGDLRYAMARSWVSFGSDGSAVRPDGPLGRGKPHPRWYGTFPRILGKYVREEGVLALEQAIWKMTGANAEKLGIKDRGLIREGYRADLTVFDADSVTDKASFDHPHQYPEGIVHVIVNGIVVLRDSEHTGAKPGRVLRKN